MGGQRLLNPQGRFFINQDVGLEAETRSRESPERWRRSESRLGPVFVGGEKDQEQRVPDGVRWVPDPIRIIPLQISNIWRIRSR